VTHPYHGQKVQVITRKGRKQPEGEIWVELSSGEQRTIPVGWTDQVGEEKYPQGVCFPVRKLQELRDALDLLMAEQRQGIMAEDEGGSSHDTGEDSSLAGNAIGKTSADHHDFGADAAARDCGDAESRGGG